MINKTRPTDYKQKKRVTANINKVIQLNKEDGYLDTNDVSDGYHTFGELYEHRIVNYIMVCKLYNAVRPYIPMVWRTTTYSDDSVWEGWFLLGIFKEKGQQITYHLPMSKWEECEFAETLNKAPEFDGHTSADVLERLKNL